jgi:predicted TIM-barrel fold metal-dependent hydrolase
MTDYPAIDADGHVREPEDLWQRYVPAGLRERAPKKVPGPGAYWLVDGVEVPPRRSYSRTTKDLAASEDRFQQAASTGYSPSSQLDAMDVEEIARSVLFPSAGLVIMGVNGVDPAVTTAAARAYNTWLSEFCAEGDGRLFGVAALDPRDVAGAMAEARRAAEAGFVGVFLRPNPVNSLPWHDSAYDPLWSVLQDLDLAVCFHEGGAVRLPQVSTDRFVEHAFWHICTHPMEQQMAMVSIVLGGVATRFPSLRFAFLECGAGWLPYWMWRMDEAVEGEEVDFAHLDLTPSELVTRQCFVSIDSDEEPGIYTLEQLDVAHVVWGSDYPHHDGKFPNALKTVSNLPGMTDARRRQVVFEAPGALFGPAVGAPTPG